MEVKSLRPLEYRALQEIKQGGHGYQQLLLPLYRLHLLQDRDRILYFNLTQSSVVVGVLTHKEGKKAQKQLWESPPP